MKFVNLFSQREDDKDDRDNRANQLNPNNDTYYSSRDIDRDDD